jgi:hypothetical protein
MGGCRAGDPRRRTCYTPRVRLALFPLLLVVPLAAACSSQPRLLYLDIVTGHETDAMTQDPKVTSVSVKGTTPEGELIEAEAAPGGTLDFGDINGDLAYTFEVTGSDGAGEVVLRGRSIGVVITAIGGDALPLFVQRLGTWARPPGELSHAHVNAPATTVGERYLLSTGGESAKNAAESEQYDLLGWAGAGGTTFPFAAQSLVSEVSRVMALGNDAAGKQGTWLDSSGFATPILPDGLTSFAEVAGGVTVLAPDYRAFVVGATRPGEPTDAVLEVATDGTLTVHRLTSPRAGAAAVWLADVGLVVAGGSETANGVEVLPEKGTLFAERDFPPDATAGAGAVATTLGTLGLIGGTSGGTAAKTRLFDPRCMSECKVKEVDGATPPLALTRVAAFPLTKGRAIAIGDEVDAAGTTRTFVIDYLEGSVLELPLREPRRGATAVPAPNGTLALIGGTHPDGTEALTVETYFPE